MTWKDITIDKYLQLYAIQKVGDVIDREVQMLSILENVPEKEIEKLKVSEIVELMKKFEFLKTLPSEKPITISFRCGDYRLHPCLLTSEMTAAQFIDFSNVCKEIKSDDLPYRMADIIACMCKVRRVTAAFPFIKYEYNGYQKISKAIHKEMSIADAYPLFVFFCNVLNNLQPAMKNYLEQKVKKEMKAVKKILQEA